MRNVLFLISTKIYDQHKIAADNHLATGRRRKAEALPERKYEIGGKTWLLVMVMVMFYKLGDKNIMRKQYDVHNFFYHKLNQNWKFATVKVEEQGGGEKLEDNCQEGDDQAKWAVITMPMVMIITILLVVNIRL